MTLTHPNSFQRYPLRIGERASSESERAGCPSCEPDAKIALGMLIAFFLAVSLTARAPDAEDARALFLKVIENQERNEDLVRQYAFDETTTTETLAADGTVKKTESLTYEVTPTIDGEYRRLVAKNGKPLSPAGARKEEEKLRARLEELRSLSPGEKEKARTKVRRRTDRFKTRLRESIEVFDFTRLPDVTLDGRTVAVFDFVPRPGYKPRSRATSVLAKLEGTVWVDPERAQLVKLHARFRESFSLAGGVFGNVSKGSQATAEQKDSRGEVWLLDRITLRVRARLYFLKRYNAVVTTAFGNYRKFTVATEEGDFRPAPTKKP